MNDTDLQAAGRGEVGCNHSERCDAESNSATRQTANLRYGVSRAGTVSVVLSSYAWFGCGAGKSIVLKRRRFSVARVR